MKMRDVKLLLAMILLFGTPYIIYCQTESSLQEKPNIIFFLVDDMGWMDCTINGSQYYETPNVERLAKMGMKFTNAYTANPLCSPTRASILTGKYPGRFHLTKAAGHLPPNPDEKLMKENAVPWKKMVDPDTRTFLPLEEYTIAEALKEGGYTTGFIGKWHLGHEAYWPKKQGFDINIAGGHYPGPPGYFSPYKIKTLADGPEHEYITDRLTDEALTYIEDKKDSTFFLALWHYAVHAPFQAQLDLIEKYEQKTDPRGKQDNPIMGAMIESMDKSLGMILDKLEKLNLIENTVIIFFSDNGGNMYDLVNGTTVTNNYPLKYGKGNIHEGGVRVPAIVFWPEKINPGTTSEEIISSIDFYPTILEMARLKLKRKQTLDGESITPVLTGKGKLKRSAIFCHFPHYTPATNNLPSTSVRKGDWKLIRVYGEGLDKRNAYELYNLKQDIGENNNLADLMPEKVKELDKLISKHIKDIDGMVPSLNPAYNSKVKSPMGKRKEFPVEKYPSY